MKNYALDRAIMLEEGGSALSPRNLWRNFRAKQRVTRLDQLDDHLLRDIGVTRDEVEWASGLPLTVNAALALEERAFRRRHVGR